MSDQAGIVLLPDAGPLITLAYADALDLLFKPGWPLALVDRVLDEVTRNQTPTSQKLAQWANAHLLPVLPTRIFAHFKQMQSESPPLPRRANLGELAIQEVMNDLALERPPKDRRLSVRGPQDCPRQLSVARELSQGQHPGLSELSGAAGLAGFRRRCGASGDPRRP